jgi:hypothetical protein
MIWSIVLSLLVVVFAASAQTTMPSWNDGEAKTAIVKFVQAVTDAKSTDYVTPADRPPRRRRA